MAKIEFQLNVDRRRLLDFGNGRASGEHYAGVGAC